LKHKHSKLQKFLLLFLIIFGVGASGITGYALVTGTPILSIFSSGIFSSGSGAKALKQGEMQLESESSTSINPQEITPTDSTAVSSNSASSIDPDAKIDENQLSPQGNTSIAPQYISVTTSQNPTSTSSNSASSKPSSTASKPVSSVSSSPESTVSSEPVSSAPDSSPSDHHTAPRISGVNLDKTQMTLNKGDISAVLTPTITPSNASGDKSITWSTDNANIATVDNIGHITAVGGGTATITATTSNGKTAACIVTVLVPASTIEINSEDFSIDKGASKTLTATVGPEDATDKTVIWATSNNDVVLVDGNGKITAENVGTATITATTGDGKLSAICEVTVGISISTLTLDKTELILIKGTEEILTATVDPPDTTENKTVEWISSKPTVADVDSTGRITAIEGGTAVITAQVGSHVDECVVTVIVPATGISLNKSAFTLPKGTHGGLTATITPEDATDKAVEWTSSDESIATVDSDGKITALSVGVAVITAKSHDGGFTAECTVSVVIPVTGITFDRTELTMNKGNSDQLVAAISPIDATDQAVTWSSSNPDVVSTDQHGSITAVSAGSAVISVTTHDGNYTASCDITVIVPVTNITLNKSASTLLIGDSEVLIATITPDDATDKTITWSSSDNTVVTVDTSGKVTPIAIGNAVISAKAGELSTACSITVTDQTVPEAPQNLIAAMSGSSVTYSFSSPISDGNSPILGYNVYKNGVKVNSTLLQTKSITITASSTQTHTIKVIAVNAIGESNPLQATYQITDHVSSYTTTEHHNRVVTDYVDANGYSHQHVEMWDEEVNHTSHSYTVDKIA